jgi:hypothetical protein
MIDREEIVGFEEWWKRIEELIIRADTIVFVLSPDAVSSNVWRKELEFAASLKKRFAPIVCRSVDIEAIPDELARLNLMFFDEAHFDERAARASSPRQAGRLGLRLEHCVFAGADDEQVLVPFDPFAGDELLEQRLHELQSGGRPNCLLWPIAI